MYSNDPESRSKAPSTRSEPTESADNRKSFIVGLTVGSVIAGVVWFERNHKIAAIKDRYEKYLDAVAKHGEHHV